MTLIKTGGGLTDIRGGFGGVYFTRDKSGLHCSAKPRRVKQRSCAQNTQRDAFSKVRAYTQIPRWVSYYIKRTLNDLPLLFEAIVTGDPDPDCRGTYILGGIHNGKDYYKHYESEFYIFFRTANKLWYITTSLGFDFLTGWSRNQSISGIYVPGPFSSGNPVVTLSLLPPPPNYQI